MKKMNQKGFTMAELLIVVAIIAVLVAIAIPIFTAQLEKSREATDAANIRAAYAEVVAAGISGETDATKLTKNVTLKQKTADWQNAPELPDNATISGTPVVGKTVTVTYSDTEDANHHNVTITFNN